MTQTNPAPERAQTGAELIAAERQRQIEREGWTAEHDDNHRNGELARAAACYAVPLIVRLSPTGNMIWSALWPWPGDWWKPSTDEVRNLAEAGALIAAEIDRLQRLKNTEAK